MIDKAELEKTVQRVKEKGYQELRKGGIPIDEASLRRAVQAEEEGRLEELRKEVDVSKAEVSEDVLTLEWGMGKLELDPSPELVPAMIRYCPKPLFIVNGKDHTDKKELALFLANFGLEKGYFEGAATNFENEKFNRIRSLEGVREWISANKVFILGGADRHLSELDKSSKLNKEFLKFAKLLKEVNASCLLVAPEQPPEYEEGLYARIRKPVDLDERLLDPKIMAAWINIFDKREVENEGWRGFLTVPNHRADTVNYLLTQGFDDLRDDNPEFIVDYDSTDPCNFQLSKSKKKEKQAEENLEPLDVDLYLAHEVEGKSFRELEEERDLGRSAIHQRVQKVKKAQGGEDNEE